MQHIRTQHTKTQQKHIKTQQNISNIATPHIKHNTAYQNKTHNKKTEGRCYTLFIRVTKCNH